MFFSKIFLAVLFLAVYFTSLGQVTIGYCDSDYLLTSHPLYKKAVDDYNSEHAKITAEYTKKKDSFDKKLKEYSQLSTNNNVSNETLTEKQNELMKLDEELKEAAKDFETYLDTKKDEIMQPIIDDVNKSLKSVNKKLKLSAIFQATNSEGVSFVLYAPEETEVTGNLLRETHSENASNFTKEYTSEPGGLKIGYTNVEMVLSYMPEYVGLQDSLETYSNELTEEYEAKRKSLLAFNTEYLEKEKAGSLSVSEQNDFERKIRSMSLDLETFGESIESNLLTMKQERMDVILSKLQNAIDKIAVEKGFTMILNQTTSSGLSTIVYGPNEGDISSALFEEVGGNRLFFDKVTAVPKDNLKVGFVNVEVIMSKMSEFNIVQEKIDAYIQSVVSKENGLANELSEEEQQKSWAKAEQDVLRYRGELMEPLMTRIQDEIDKLAKSKGYDYIINQTGNNILFVADKHDVQSALMKALDIK